MDDIAQFIVRYDYVKDRDGWNMYVDKYYERRKNDKRLFFPLLVQPKLDF